MFRVRAKVSLWTTIQTFLSASGPRASSDTRRVSGRSWPHRHIQAVKENTGHTCLHLLDNLPSPSTGSLLSIKSTPAAPKCTLSRMLLLPSGCSRTGASLRWHFDPARRSRLLFDQRGPSTDIAISVVRPKMTLRNDIPRIDGIVCRGDGGPCQGS